MPSPGVHLTLDQLATILALLDVRPPREIAELIGAKYNTVLLASRRFRLDGGWLCHVRVVNCAECGAPLLVNRAKPMRVHVACRRARIVRWAREARAEGRATLSTPFVRAYNQAHPEQYQAGQRKAHERRKAQWPDLPAEVRAAHLAELYAGDQRDYALTHASAAAHAGRWTADDDAYILAHLTEPAREVAIALGRTLFAVRDRRTHLRKKGDLADLRG